MAPSIAFHGFAEQWREYVIISTLQSDCTKFGAFVWNVHITSLRHLTMADTYVHSAHLEIMYTGHVLIFHFPVYTSVPTTGLHNGFV